MITETINIIGYIWQFCINDYWNY